MIAHTENVRDRGAADWRRWYASIEETRGKRLASSRRARFPDRVSPLDVLGPLARRADLSLARGDNVVGDDMEFPSNVYPWMMLAERARRIPPGVEPRGARRRR